MNLIGCGIKQSWPIIMYDPGFRSGRKGGRRSRVAASRSCKAEQLSSPVRRKCQRVSRQCCRNAYNILELRCDIKREVVPARWGLKV